MLKDDQEQLQGLMSKPIKPLTITTTLLNRFGISDRNSVQFSNVQKRKIEKLKAPSTKAEFINHCALVQYMEVNVRKTICALSSISPY